MSLTSERLQQLREVIELSLNPAGGQVFVLVSCSKSKRSQTSQVSNMYTSHLFRGSVALAESISAPYYVLSAKHGLLSPRCVIPPYDAYLGDLSAAEIETWADDVSSTIDAVLPSQATLVFLASQQYSGPLRKRLSSKRFKMLEPLCGLSIGYMGEWLGVARRMVGRRAQAVELYGAIEHALGGAELPTLREYMGSKNLTKQGVYLFFEDGEPTEFNQRLPRIVRIGTHAVSAGSSTTLRDRLRTHMGTADGDGNHRGSVFRLHVGNAIIKARNLSGEYPDWGKGQSATKDVKNQERRLEQEVSKYLSRLRVFCLPLSGPASKSSIRSRVEAAIIGVLTQDGMALERPTQNWLGLNSTRSEIRESGLWNLQHLGVAPDKKAFESALRVLTRDGELSL
jgi:hypothetical protein